MSDLIPRMGRPSAAVDATDALASAASYARAEKSAATRKAYANDFQDFTIWCERLKVPNLPASAETLCGYLAAIADAGLSSSTISRRLAAITYAHKLAKLEVPASEPVFAVLRGIRRTIGTATSRKSPLTAQSLARVMRWIPDNLVGSRDRAILLIGFAAALRRSEIAALDVADIERIEGGVILHMRRSKTDQEGEGHEIGVPHGKRLRPIAALDEWLLRSQITAGPLFRAVRLHQVATGRLTDRAIADVVKHRAALAGLDPRMFSGHSLRAGFVTTALAASVDPFKVMDITRHRRIENLRVYDRRAKVFKDHAGASFL